MTTILTPIAEMIDYFKSLPGVGPRMAERMAYRIIKSSPEFVKGFAQSLVELKETVGYCQSCHNVSMGPVCAVCEDGDRDQDLICVVEDVQDLLAIARVQAYRGVFHVLHGSLSPLDGVGPDDLTIEPLVVRLGGAPSVREVIIATNPTVEGEATATYIAQRLRPRGVRVTRIAQGIPRGGDLEYADGYTLQKAFEGRTEL